MCGPGGKSTEPRGLPAQPVTIELEEPRPRTSTRPHTSTADRPRTSKRTHTSSGENRPQSTRPQSHRRTESRQRPEGSSHRTKTSDGRRSSHTSGHHKERSRHEFPPIEEHTDDQTLIRHFGELALFIVQHVATFYPSSVDPGFSGSSEMDDPRTRQPALRKYIMQRVGGEIVMADRDRFEEHR